MIQGADSIQAAIQIIGFELMFQYYVFCEGSPLVTTGFSTQMASEAEFDDYSVVTVAPFTNMVQL